jgi:uncharacterized membrane protein YsdA (DUF1294 family)
MAKSRPAGRYALWTFGLAVMSALLLSRAVSTLGALWAWLIAINGVAFLTYGYDKAIAGSRRTRVPESVLLALAAAGGSAGAWIGQRVFRHKTSKVSFGRRFTWVVAIQVMLLVVYWVWIAPGRAGR